LQFGILFCPGVADLATPTVPQNGTMAHRTAPAQRDDRLLRAIDELFATLDAERTRTEEQDRECSRSHAESLLRRLALAFHDLGLSELTDGWSTAEDGQLRFTDLVGAENSSGHAEQAFRAT
jgi:hypothetical protein